MATFRELLAGKVIGAELADGAVRVRWRPRSGAIEEDLFVQRVVRIERAATRAGGFSKEQP